MAEIHNSYEPFEIELIIENLNEMNGLNTTKIKTSLTILVLLVLLLSAGLVITILVIINRNHRIRQMRLEIQNYLLKAKQHANPDCGCKEITDTHTTELKEEFGLTHREIEILALLAGGLTNTQLARKLFISDNTVKYHIKNIYLKLDVKNRIEALHKIHLLN